MESNGFAKLIYDKIANFLLLRYAVELEYPQRLPRVLFIFIFR
jgi:hypothetical protein